MDEARKLALDSTISAPRDPVNPPGVDGRTCEMLRKYVEDARGVR
jgi:hypothetical protein